MYHLTEYTEEMKEQALTLVNATEQLGEIIKKFKKVSDVDDITKSNIAMKELETQGCFRQIFQAFSAASSIKLEIGRASCRERV